jgi:hypothetical protein
MFDPTAHRHAVHCAVEEVSLKPRKTPYTPIYLAFRLEIAPLSLVLFKSTVRSLLNGSDSSDIEV